ncbi:hypothetical protein SK128_004179 [Halocaridina rubra]|uniref:Fibronectin type-II domain-containing protein n=1 Tax=Halocaridina rubra TaxID=373956 RepID=A0AAN8XAB4_HALRR
MADVACFHSGMTDVESKNVTRSGIQCVFPFLFRGQLYKECTCSDDMLPWCATNVNQEKHVIASDYCRAYAEQTFTEDGEECAFPFKHEGEWHHTCIATQEAERPWCVTRSGQFGIPISTGKCLGESMGRHLFSGAIRLGGLTENDTKDAARCD